MHGQPYIKINMSIFGGGDGSVAVGEETQDNNIIFFVTDYGRRRLVKGF